MLETLQKAHYPSRQGPAFASNVNAAIDDLAYTKYSGSSHSAVSRSLMGRLLLEFGVEDVDEKSMQWIGFGMKRRIAN